MDVPASDRRGLAIGLVVFGAMIAIGGMLFFLLFQEGLTPLFDSASTAAETQEGQEQITLASAIAGGMAVYVLIVACLFLVARSVVESRGPG
jgi:nitrate reductase gamma subunit